MSNVQDYGAKAAEFARPMRDDEGTEDLAGEDWRSKAQGKGERHYGIPSRCRWNGRANTGEAERQAHPKRSRRWAGATFSGEC